MTIEEGKATREEMRKNERKFTGNAPIHPYIQYTEGIINKEQLASIFLEDFYCKHVIDEKIETSKLYLGTLTFVEGDATVMLIEANYENNVDEKCILYPVMMTPHSGTVFLDIFNKTLIETKCGFASFGNIKKAGILVENGEPLNKVMNKEIAEIDEIKSFVDEINKQKQKTRKF